LRFAQNPQIVQEAMKATNPNEVWRPLVDPEERAKFGIQQTDKTPYKVDRNGNFQSVASPQTNINTAPGTPAQVFTTVEKRADEARAAAQSLPSFAEARRLGNSGNIILGQGADLQVGLQKLAGVLGYDTSAASNSETFRSAIAPTVLALVKGLGAGSGISNADREFAEKAAGGNINLEPATIKRLLDIGERAARAKVDGHNRMVDSVYPETDQQNGQVRSLFRVDVPEYQPPAPPPQGATPMQPAPQTQQNAAPPVQGARQGTDGGWYVPDPNRPGKYMRVQQ
jgi:hypothetical protein